MHKTRGVSALFLEFRQATAGAGRSPSELSLIVGVQAPSPNKLCVPANMTPTAIDYPLFSRPPYYYLLSIIVVNLFRITLFF